jgi:hypothetical protein
MLLVFVLSFPAFVLGPLVALLAASRPASRREWIWLGLGGLWIVLLAGQASGIASTMLIAWALTASGAFAALMLTRQRGLTAGALGAATIATVATTAWARLLGTHWQDVMLAVAHESWALLRDPLATSDLSPERAAGVQVYLETVADGVAMAAALFPGLLVLAGLAGMGLAWTWYHRIALRPFGRPTRPFREFGFDDHLVWVVVLSVALLVLPLPEQATVVGANLALVAGGLYAGRGAAVTWTVIEGMPSGGLVILGLGVFLFLPVTLCGLILLGLADTWVDFRRRFTPAVTGG